MRSSRFSMLAVVGLMAAAVTLAAEHVSYRVRPVITVDRDDKDIPEPQKYSEPVMWEFFDASIIQTVKYAIDVPRKVKRRLGDYPAITVNVMDDVPDSSWYTNRVIGGRLTPAEVNRGPALHDPPAFDGEIILTHAKEGGISPGFIVRDRKGATWFLKFDPPDYPGMMSSAEVIGSKIFWAAGYNVPEEWIVTLRPGQIRIDPKTRIKAGKELRPMTRADLDEILKRSHRNEDGSYRAVASLLLPGKLKGPFEFVGMRADDPNDLIPHEHRRDLRGLRVLCAWVDHDDVKPANTMASYIEEGGRHFLLHYLMDFGSIMGSDSVFPNQRDSGHAYIIDYDEMAKSLFTLGIWQPKWSKDEIPVYYPSVGRFSSSDFDPVAWRPNMPSAAFDNMMDSDGYWGTRIVAAFTPELVRAAAHAGQFTDPRAEGYLADTLLSRRAKILRHWLALVTPLERFRVGPLRDGTQQITFTDLAVQTGIAPARTQYGYRFYRTNGERHPLTERLTTGQPAIQVPPQLLAEAAREFAGASTADDRVVHVDIRSGSAKPVRAYFVFEGPDKGLRLAGIQHRDSD